ncbi:gamma-glutamyl-gamma-aminobutyrate hydrolase family protein [Acidomonas methanolica]|uniref:gamma-glutamyl-gamma-aminobutyrate hydrolase family protein n=1 Tax=Acidomonas methanolica TaxID=437 RepID=UPI00211A11C8|nr:gamma-glutamyl-gamma-aminobutyrate hydrolase family protein [Acidomonas methanolica]MCQ9155675.1 gamma-glutamyl-gamma-aminobutyrate hydrolase family protein [Acidomonas methanolica]
MALIGVTLDQEPGGSGAGGEAYSSFPWYALRRNYFTAIASAGGLPVGLGHEEGLSEALMDRLDGLVVTGGAFDLDPALFGEAPHAATVLKPERTRAELALLRAALARRLPVLGICGGMQLLAVASGGSLIQHLPDEIRGGIAHEQPNPRDEAGHDITIRPGSLLARIAGRTRMAVNSSHHQAVRTPGTLTISAYAADGVVEAVEGNGETFCLGVQWHPEFGIDPADNGILTAFIAACTTARNA